MLLQEMFYKIREYHEKLGYNYTGMSLEQQMEAIRHNGLALHQEVAELIDSFPWKPWRDAHKQRWDNENATEEIVDILFFLGNIMEAVGIDPEDLELMFEVKLKENYDRIERGYNNKPEERR